MKLLTTFLLLTILTTGCKQEPCYEDTGTIIGQDYRKCMCCGGWFIEINQDTLRFDQLPDSTNVNLTDAVYPIEVYLDWQHKDPKCLGDEIIVTRMELKQK